MLVNRSQNTFIQVLEREPLVIILFGLVQLSFFKLWPYEYWENPFYFFDIRELDERGIHAHAYGAAVHNYLYYICLFFFVWVKVKEYRPQMSCLLFLEFFDLIDFFLRYNMKMFDIYVTEGVAFKITYTEMKKVFYALIILQTWKLKTS